MSLSIYQCGERVSLTLLASPTDESAHDDAVVQQSTGSQRSTVMNGSNQVDSSFQSPSPICDEDPSFRSAWLPTAQAAARGTLGRVGRATQLAQSSGAEEGSLVLRGDSQLRTVKLVSPSFSIARGSSGEADLSAEASTPSLPCQPHGNVSEDRHGFGQAGDRTDGVHYSFSSFSRSRSEPSCSTAIAADASGVHAAPLDSTRDGRTTLLSGDPPRDELDAVQAEAPSSGVGPSPATTAELLEGELRAPESTATSQLERGAVAPSQATATVEKDEATVDSANVNVSAASPSSLLVPSLSASTVSDAPAAQREDAEPRALFLDGATSSSMASSIHSTPRSDASLPERHASPLHTAARCVTDENSCATASMPASDDFRDDQTPIRQSLSRFRPTHGVAVETKGAHALPAAFPPAFTPDSARKKEALGSRSAAQHLTSAKRLPSEDGDHNGEYDDSCKKNGTSCSPHHIPSYLATPDPCLFDGAGLRSEARASTGSPGDRRGRTGHDTCSPAHDALGDESQDTPVSRFTGFPSPVKLSPIPTKTFQNAVLALLLESTPAALNPLFQHRPADAGEPSSVHERVDAHTASDATGSSGDADSHTVSRATAGETLSGAVVQLESEQVLLLHEEEEEVSALEQISTTCVWSESAPPRPLGSFTGAATHDTSSVTVMNSCRSGAGRRSQLFAALPNLRMPSPPSSLLSSSTLSPDHASRLRVAESADDSASAEGVAYLPSNAEGNGSSAHLSVAASVYPTPPVSAIFSCSVHNPQLASNPTSPLLGHAATAPLRFSLLPVPGMRATVKAASATTSAARAASNSAPRQCNGRTARRPSPVSRDVSGGLILSPPYPYPAPVLARAATDASRESSSDKDSSPSKLFMDYYFSSAKKPAAADRLSSPSLDSLQQPSELACRRAASRSDSPFTAATTPSSRAANSSQRLSSSPPSVPANEVAAQTRSTAFDTVSSIQTIVRNDSTRSGSQCKSATASASATGASAAELNAPSPAHLQSTETQLCESARTAAGCDRTLQWQQYRRQLGGTVLKETVTRDDAYHRLFLLEARVAAKQTRKLFSSMAAEHLEAFWQQHHRQRPSAALDSFL